MHFVQNHLGTIDGHVSDSQMYPTSHDLSTPPTACHPVFPYSKDVFPAGETPGILGIHTPPRESPPSVELTASRGLDQFPQQLSAPSKGSLPLGIWGQEVGRACVCVYTVSAWPSYKPVGMWVLACECLCTRVPPSPGESRSGAQCLRLVRLLLPTRGAGPRVLGTGAAACWGVVHLVAADFFINPFCEQTQEFML